MTLRKVATWIILWLWTVLTCEAQPTNMAVFQGLALDCMAESPDTAAAFQLEVPEHMLYLRTSLVRHWNEEDRVVYVVDSLFQPPRQPLPLLQLEVQEAKVEYQRGKKRHVTRTVTLAIRNSLIAADGRLLGEELCKDTYSDTLHRKHLSLIESAAHPETRAPLPDSGWLHRYLEPAVITAASAIGVYLFFTLRSDRADETP